MRNLTYAGLFCIAVSLLASVLLSCERGKKDTRRWYKGNLHTHSYWSDGDEFPEMIMDWYKSHGYNFLALSDHNILAEGEKWVKVPNSRMYEEGFQQYVQRFGEEWVTHRMDSGRILVRLKTLEEYRPLFEDESFLVIPSEELTDGYDGRPVHVNATNIKHHIPPQGGGSVLEVLQRNVDAVLRQREETGVPMFPHINHPNFFYGVSLRDMIELRGERFFEVYNGHPLVNNYGDSLRPGTETMWDLINIAYSNRNQPLMYGLATDDSHNYHQFGTAYANAGRGWVMVRADSLTPASIIRAMEAGDFYATTGVLLDDVSFDEGMLHIRVKEEPGVKYEIRIIGVAASQPEPRELEVVEGTEAHFKVTDEYLFVRAKVVSDRVKENPFKEGDVEVAWTQPVSTITGRQ
jgi:hypothetical protein